MSPSTRTHDAATRREAARALLAHPLLTDRTHPEELAAVRMHARELSSLFTQMLGYQLVVEPTFARLLKEPPGPHAPWRGAHRRSGAPFTSRTYTYLALVCAALWTSEVGEQVLVSRLVEQVRAEAQIVGVQLDDQLAERRHLVAALEWLVDQGVLEETEGTIGRWADQHDEALLSVNRALLPHLLARPLRALPGPGPLLDGTPARLGPDQPRRSLRAKLVEHPVVDRDDLSDGERDALSRERTELTRALGEAFGLSVEVRAEGALAHDADGHLTDTAFPGQGTVAQAALLLIDAATDTYRPGPASTAALGPRQVKGLALTHAQVEELLAELVERYGRSWSASRTADVSALRAAVVDLLVSVGLMRQVGQNLALSPAAARFRPQPHAAGSLTRAKARMQAASPAVPTPVDLFDQEY